LIKAFLNKLRYSQGHGGALARGAIGAFIIKLVGAGLLFGLHVLLARLIGVRQYGIYVYVLTWINILAVVSQLGLNTSLVRFIAAYRAQGKWGLLRGFLRLSTQWVVVFGLLSSAIGGVVVWVLCGRIGWDEAVTFCVAFILLPILVLVRLREASLRALSLGIITTFRAFSTSMSKVNHV